METRKSTGKHLAPRVFLDIIYVLDQDVSFWGRRKVIWMDTNIGNKLVNVFLPKTDCKNSYAESNATKRNLKHHRLPRNPRRKKRMLFS